MKNLLDIFDKYNIDLTFRQLIQLMSNADDSEIYLPYEEILVIIQRDKIMLYDARIQNYILTLEVK